MLRGWSASTTPRKLALLGLNDQKQRKQAESQPGSIVKVLLAIIRNCRHELSRRGARNCRTPQVWLITFNRGMHNI
jgi:hypothetical protein